MQFDPGMEYRPDWVEANGKCTSNHTNMKEEKNKYERKFKQI